VMSNANPWDNLKFDVAGIEEVIRKLFITLHSTYNFFALYADLDDFYFVKPALNYDMLHQSDRWIISCLHTLVQTTTEAYDNYEPTLAARAIQDFVVNDVSNWYVRLNRKRFWKNSHDLDKEAAYQTLYLCLIGVAKLMAPIAPFYADYLYKALNDVTKKEVHISVHLADFPVADSSCIELDLEKQMGQVQTIVSLAHALRKQHKIKVRQPLVGISIANHATLGRNDLVAFEELIKTEINVKQVSYLEHTDQFVHKRAKPNFSVLGKQYGNKMKPLSEAILALSQEEIAALEIGKTHFLNIGDQEIVLTSSDVFVVTEDIPGWCVAKQDGITIALDIHLDDALKQEGMAREWVHAIQQLRKEMGFEVQDKIYIKIEEGNQLVRLLIDTYNNYIATETQALSLECVPLLTEGFSVIDLDGISIKFALTKAPY